MRVLVVGGGGREHALCWKIRQSPMVAEVHCAPGNAGIAELATCVDIPVGDTQALIDYAKQHGIGLTVVGPEDPLCAGIVDAFAAAGLKAFGPDRRAAEIEGSKAFARELCERHRIPSPWFRVFDQTQAAVAFLEAREDGAAEGSGVVVKASGLAAGKGVVVTEDRAAAIAAARQMMERNAFGSAGNTVVIEERLSGPELSVMTLTDGSTIIPFEPARDHKPVGEGDKGPNTGGMGAFTPVSVGSRTLSQVERGVLFPAVHAMNREERRYRGFLYAGLMLTTTGPKVLEFNCRLGDPETQPLMMRLKSDLVPLMLATVDGTLDQVEPPEWDTRPAVCVMACSGGYPGEYRKGLPIQGLDAVASGPDLQVFHSGTRRALGQGAGGPDAGASSDGGVVTAGGRVLSVCALGETLEDARRKAYGELAKISFPDMHYRKDIGAKPAPTSAGSSW